MPTLIRAPGSALASRSRTVMHLRATLRVCVCRMLHTVHGTAWHARTIHRVFAVPFYRSRSHQWDLVVGNATKADVHRVCVYDVLPPPQAATAKRWVCVCVQTHNMLKYHLLIMPGCWFGELVHNVPGPIAIVWRWSGGYGSRSGGALQSQMSGCHHGSSSCCCSLTTPPPPLRHAMRDRIDGNTRNWQWRDNRRRKRWWKINYDIVQSTHKVPREDGGPHEWHTNHMQSACGVSSPISLVLSR